MISQLSPSEILTQLPVLKDAGLSAFIHGPTGIGKSNVVEQYCSSEDRNELTVLYHDARPRKDLREHGL